MKLQKVRDKKKNIKDWIEINWVDICSFAHGKKNCIEYGNYKDYGDTVYDWKYILTSDFLIAYMTNNEINVENEKFNVKSLEDPKKLIYEII
jgi:hypothetical protein